MEKFLYNSFASRWNRGGSVWFYSDPHFADEEMKYIRKNYIGDEEQVRRINSKISDKDTLIILGDIGDESFVDKLKGYKVLIKGNHDHGVTSYKKRLEYLEDYVTFDEAVRAKKNREIDYYLESTRQLFSGFKRFGVFDEVYEGCLMISPKIILSHEPVEFAYALNIHGHKHDIAKIDDMHFNVCAEYINYTPVCLSHLVKQGLLKNIPDIHRETIDKATEKNKNS